MPEQTKKMILLIDDEVNLLVTLGDFLRFEGYEVVTAESGEQGLKKLAKCKPDLIILDMSMPGMGGIGFLKEISTPAGKPKYPVVVLTARSNMAEFFSTVEVEGFIAKPCDPNDLLMEVGRIIFLRGGTGPDARNTAQGRKRKALIAEDDLEVNARIVNAFTTAGYIVEWVRKGPEVLERAVVSRPDVVVLKLILADMNGDAVAGLLRQMPNTRNIPIVLYDESGSAQSGNKYLGSGPGARKFVRGNNAAELLTAANTILQGM